MPRTLGSLATIGTGFHYRTKITDDPGGEWRVAQGREVRADLSWNSKAMPRVTPGPAERRARLKPGDVLVLVRGEKPYAMTVPDWPWPTLASSSFYILRVKREVLLPGYLTWYLNTPGVVQKLSDASRGAKIKWLPRAALLALEIPAPTLPRQQAIAEAASLVAEESRLHAELAAERETALAMLPSAAESGETASRAAHIKLAEAQLDVVRDRLNRHFTKLGL